jgi:hypothetical protein
MVRILGCKARMAMRRCEDARRERSKSVEEAKHMGGPRSPAQPRVSGQQYNLEAGMHFAYVDAIRTIRGRR